MSIDKSILTLELGFALLIMFLKVVTTPYAPPSMTNIRTPAIVFRFISSLIKTTGLS